MRYDSPKMYELLYHQIAMTAIAKEEMEERLQCGETLSGYDNKPEDFDFDGSYFDQLRIPAIRETLLRLSADIRSHRAAGTLGDYDEPLTVPEELRFLTDFWCPGYSGTQIDPDWLAQVIVNILSEVRPIPDGTRVLRVFGDRMAG